MRATTRRRCRRDDVGGRCHGAPKDETAAKKRNLDRLHANLLHVISEVGKCKHKNPPPAVVENFLHEGLITCGKAFLPGGREAAKSLAFLRTVEGSASILVQRSFGGDATEAPKPSTEEPKPVDENAEAPKPSTEEPKPVDENAEAPQPATASSKSLEDPPPGIS